MFIRMNKSDAKTDYDTDYEVSKIQIFISKVKEKKNKRERKQNKRTRRRNKKIKTSIKKSKCISCQKCFAKLQRMKNTQSKIKPIKTGKELGTTHNFRPQEVKMTSKVLVEKSNCVVCRSNKSRFLYKKRNNNKK